jgi:hypothetical protein
MTTLSMVKSAYNAAILCAAAAGALSLAVPHAYAAPAQKKPGVKLTSSALIERTEKDASGTEKKVMKTPAQVAVVPGDRVTFVLNYINESTQAAAGFRATNPMPGAIQFIGVREDWAEVSVDGGVNYGKLAGLSVTSGTPATSRAASPSDVTHVRWVFPAEIGPGKTGSLSYSGVVK